MKTMISNLPNDMVEEILSRVPQEHMREVRLTCKKWNDLSKTQSFREMHIGKASKKEGDQYQMIALMDYDLYLTSFFIVDGGHDLSFEHKSKHSFPNEQLIVSEVHHCKGLLLCVLKDDPRLLVWNMYLRERRWIKPRCSYRPKGWDMFSYALGYEDSKKDCGLKLLRFIDNYSCDPESFWYEMYDFESCLWTTLDIITPHWHIEFHNHGVTLKGNTYWYAGDRKLDYGDLVDDRIICFDFTSERFGQLLPLPFSVGPDDYVFLSCFGEDKLTVLLQHPGLNPREFDIWITTKIEVGEVFFWSKLLRIGQLVPFPHAVFFTNEEKSIAMVFSQWVIRKGHKFKINGNAGYFRKLDHVSGDRHFMAYLCPYVPSLLSVQGGRKQQSESENLPVVVKNVRDLVQLKRTMIDTPASS